MTITAIEKRKRESRYDIYLDGELAATLSDEAILTYRLKSGKELDEQEWREIVCEAEKQDAVNAILAALSVKPYTERMAKDKLQQKGFVPLAIDYAVAKMVDYGYIDDADYAVEYVEETKSSRSKLRIKHDLQQKGVSAVLIDTALSKMDEEEACRRSLWRKGRGKGCDEDTQNKLTKYLLGQGFAYDTVRKCVAEWAAENENDEK